MWHIVKRELCDNLNSLRFALTTVFLIGLMLTNAIVHLREHPGRVQKYREGVAAYQNRLNPYAEESLYRLAQKGPGDLYKKPSSLRFCAEGGEIFLADHTSISHRWSTSTLESFWILTYPSVTPNVNNVRPEVTKVDWGFIIGYVLSLIALLFTFDAISGERERGTLRLTLANPISRHTLLIGKFLGALISVSIPFTFSVLANLLVISTSSDVYLDADTWGRLGIIFFIALVYTCLFLALGLLVSARVQRSAVSLVILLLTWVTLVVFMPNTLVSIAGGSASPKSTHGLSERSWQLYREILAEYRARRRDMSENSTQEIQLGSEIVIKEAEQQEQLREEHLKQRISQMNRARAITLLSPVTIFQHLLESFAGTGFERHLQFLENVQFYARQFREFIIDTDRTDPESLHIFGVREGMSQKSVPIEAVPKFEDTLSLSRDFNSAAVDLLLLTLFVIVLLSGAFLAFVRVEV
ncbi:ABC transporter permease subunit [Candidatus Poribacteria bacterium]|nr:ABC transporter permease subunit [Candidatus Poribacteria bacterium]MXV84640.1 ABC transporter permease subunit [Candidatus Poribacteria bacterium]MYA58037.1 ABC transporter permease subunit [Candidatus Poribacteria bacterium]